ncbi:hypothetical protein FQA39_LY16628, partial [Lamprigera yunnana]
CMPAATKLCIYFRRMLKFDQMDFEFASWQMFYLFVAPKKVFRNFQYRKKTKSQFARDDPAFLVLFVAWLCITSVGFAIVLRLTFWKFVRFLLYVIFMDCIGMGIIIASLFWYISNKYFCINEKQDIEWGYAFDVHLNAFFPPLIILHFFQLFFYNGLMNHKWYISRYLGNTYWLFAGIYYIYITFLGYSSLPMSRRTNLLLVPLPIIVLVYIVSLSTGFNITYFLMNFYTNRI